MELVAEQGGLAGWSAPLTSSPAASTKAPTTTDSSAQPPPDYVHIFSLFLASTLWTLVMTVFPVLVDLPQNLYKPHYGWYNGDDIVRLLEPIVRYATLRRTMTDQSCTGITATPYCTCGVEWAACLTPPSLSLSPHTACL